MIRYTMKCANEHSFESWFQSSDAFEKLQKAGLLSCTVCDSTDVSKSLMAPKVTTSKAKAEEALPLATPSTEVEKALAKMRSEVEKNSEYVGTDFANQARAIHDGDTPARAIYGEAKPEEAKALIDDGVPVTPLPFLPKKSTN
ncbi:MAG: DUF1178 family protein [Planktomarina sp.]